MSRPAPLPPLPSWKPLITAPSAGHCQAMPSTLRDLPGTTTGRLEAAPFATAFDGEAGGGLATGGGVEGRFVDLAEFGGSARAETATLPEATGVAAGPGAFGTVSNTGALFCGRVSRGGAFTTVPRAGAPAVASMRSTCPGC